MVLLILYRHQDMVLDMEIIAKRIANRVQERLSNLSVDKSMLEILEEEIRKEYISTGQSNQCTQENIQENYNTF